MKIEDILTFYLTNKSNTVNIALIMPGSKFNVQKLIDDFKKEFCIVMPRLMT